MRTIRTPRSRTEVWAERGYRDGYDARFRPPAFRDPECLDVYLNGWKVGTIACIKDRSEQHGRTPQP